MSLDKKPMQQGAEQINTTVLWTGHNVEFLNYQNVCIYKMTWHRVNTIVRVLNHIYHWNEQDISILIRCVEFI